MLSISCIIPVHNEEKTIGQTLAAVLAARDIFCEIIVIDDASTDRTNGIIRSFPETKLLVNNQNLGKSATIARGVAAATGSYIFMMDADLTGLSSHHLEMMAAPIINEIADVVISLREDSPWWMKKICVDLMSGERILPRELLMTNMEALTQLRGFDLEVFINRLIIGNNLRLQTVLLTDVRDYPKWKKRGFLRGLWGEWLMWLDIFRLISIREFIQQNIALHKLLIKTKIR